MLDQAVRPPAFPTQGQSASAVKLEGKSRCTESVSLQLHSALSIILGQVFAGMRVEWGGRERRGEWACRDGSKGTKPLGLASFKRKRRWRGMERLGEEEWKREGTSPIGDNVEDGGRQFGSSAVFFQNISQSQWFFKIVRGVQEVCLGWLEERFVFQWLTLKLFLPGRSPRSTGSLRAIWQRHRGL